MKRIIQICSMLALTVVFFTVAAQAQTTNRIDAKIPFDFMVGDQSYVAGDYVIKLSKVSVNTVALSLEDNFGNQLRNVLLSTNGEVANGQERLVFDRYNDQRYLTKVLTNDRGFSLHISDAQKDAKRETIAAR